MEFLPRELRERIWRWAAVRCIDLAELERIYTSSYALVPLTAKYIWTHPLRLRDACVKAWTRSSCVPWDVIAPSVRALGDLDRTLHLIPHVASTPGACRALRSLHVKGKDAYLLGSLPAVTHAIFELEGGEDPSLCAAFASPHALTFVALVPPEKQRSNFVMVSAPVFQALSQAHAMTNVCLRNCVLDASACDALRSMFLAMRALEVVELEGCRVAHTRWVHALRGCPLRHLRIDAPGVVDALCGVVKTCAPTLGHFHVMDPCTPALVDALSTCPHLFSLGCGALPAESTALVERIGSLDVTRVSPADLQLLVNASKAPTSLRFDKAHLTRTHVHLLCQLIVVNPKVEIRMLGTSVALEDACMLAEVRHTTCPDVRIVLMHQYVRGLNTLPPSHCVFSLFPYMR